MAIDELSNNNSSNAVTGESENASGYLSISSTNSPRGGNTKPTPLMGSRKYLQRGSNVITQTAANAVLGNSISVSSSETLTSVSARERNSNLNINISNNTNNASVGAVNSFSTSAGSQRKVNTNAISMFN